MCDMRNQLAMMVLISGAACGDGASMANVDAGAGDSGIDATVSDGNHLDPTPGIYRETCDGSGAAALDADHFLDVNDENQGLRVYRRGTDAAPVQTLDISTLLGLQAGDEADFEELARVGDRLFVITSHARNTNGNIRPERYRFGAVDLATATVPITLGTTPSFTSELLQQMLVSENWDTPNSAVIAALQASSKLGDDSEPTLAPENMGTNIEGLATDGAGHLLIGFRNPRPNAKAIVVSLANPDAVLAGTTARFAGAAELDFGGLGIRSMTYSPALSQIVIVAGPHGGPGPFRLYRWSGDLAAAPVGIDELTAPTDSSPEAVVAYPGTTDVQIIYDQGDVLVNGTVCKDVPVAERSFSDAIVRIQ